MSKIVTPETGVGATTTEETPANPAVVAPGAESPASPAMSIKPAKSAKPGAKVADLAPESRASTLAALIRAKTKDPESVQIYGKGAISAIKAISTGSLGLDYALGIGGLPQGRIIEIYGPESSGKTTLSLQAMVAAQKGGGVASIVDAEHALDVNYARNLGMDTDALLVSQPSCGEEALEITEVLVTNGRPGDIVVVDSVAALTPRAEIDGEMGDSHMGLAARLMGQGLRKITGKAHENGVTVIFINQLRVKIGVMFGNPETTTGGNALKFYASVRIDIRRIQQNKVGDVVVSNRTRAKVIKNKVAPPFREAEFDIRFGTGVDYLSEVLELGVKFGVIGQSGSWYSYKEDKIGNGKEASINAIGSNPDLENTLYQAVRAAMLAPPKLPTR